MKFTKFGKALLLSALSFGVLGVTSCVQSYSVGYLYVTGTVTAQTSGNGIISGFSIDHKTGQLKVIKGLPVSSGGANPVRAVLLQAGRFLYVLNRGVTASGSSNCTSADPCLNSNIAMFTVSGNGILTPQETYFSKGTNPFRIIADSGGNYIYVLDHDSPSNGSNPDCAKALGNGLKTCGDITAFQVDATTGRLSDVANTLGLSYFPVPANPVDFVLTSTNVLTLTGPANASYPYTGGNAVFPYTVASGGQLTVIQSNPQALDVNQGTAIVSAGELIYVLDNEPIKVNGSVVANSQIMPYSVTKTNGTLTPGTAVAVDSTQENPIYAIVASGKNWLYLANQGNNNNTSGNAESGITGYDIDTNNQLTEMKNVLPFGTGSGPQCLVEDPSNQFIYTANFNDSTVTGQSIDQNSGALRTLLKGSTFALTGPATWCLVSGRSQ